jgi:hypothetical protein
MAKRVNEGGKPIQPQTCSGRIRSQPKPRAALARTLSIETAEGAPDRGKAKPPFTDETVAPAEPPYVPITGGKESQPSAAESQPASAAGSTLADKAAHATSSGVECPQYETMEAAEVLSWIALRRALPLNEWAKQIYGLSHHWPCSVQAFYDTNRAYYAASRPPYRYGQFAGSPHDFLALLNDVESGANWKDRTLSPSELPGIEKFLEGKEISELIADLKSDIAKAAPINRQLKVANEDLRKKLAVGSIKAFGGSKGGEFGELMFGRRPIEAGEWVLGKEVLPDGTVHERDGYETCAFLLFDAQEVLAIWPAERVATLDRPTDPHDEPANTVTDFATAGNSPPPAMPTDPKVLWMHAYVQGWNDAGKKPKRDPTLALSQKVTGATYREALSAWHTLPVNMRNRPRTGATSGQRAPA